jgi:histidinol-phosphatase (PHP family)
MHGLPLDEHVHSQWSWDAPRGDMERTCARAVKLGLKAIAFTDHVDLTPWAVGSNHVRPGFRAHFRDGVLVAEPLDLNGYLECLQRCRDRFPDLRILSGMEMSEPHLHSGEAGKLLSKVAFDRVLGSVHSLEDLRPTAGSGTVGGHHPAARVEVGSAYAQRDALGVFRSYLAEVVTMAKSDEPFSVLAHIDYPSRYWPANAGPFRPQLVEDEYRAALDALATSGRSLEVNTRVPLVYEVVDWWHEAGGDSVTFGSDAHEPDRLASEFTETAAMVAAHGFRPGATPYELWRRD